MAAIAPPAKHAPQLQVQAPDADKGPAAEGAAQRLEQSIEAAQDITPNKLLIRFDEQAERFVQTLTDANTEEMVRRYPSETQLAYSRAVVAYQRAHADKVNEE